MLTIACVMTNNYLGRGVEYVANLRAGVARHLSRPHRFVCLTDDVAAVAATGVDARSVPQSGLKGWWNKIALFHPSAFQAGERVLYLDLDTVITGSLDELSGYSGVFAMLEDVMVPNRVGSGVMAWRSGPRTEALWCAFREQGFPDVAGGDQAFLERAVSRIDRLQDHYPNQIASYKMSAGMLSPHTRIVAFHGQPRPHEIVSGWVPRIWAHKDN